MIEKEAPKTLISISELKEIFKKDKSSYESRIEKLKEQIDKIVTNEDWEIHEVLLEENYSSPEVLDCIIYYTTGLFLEIYMSHMIIKIISVFLQTGSNHMTL